MAAFRLLLLALFLIILGYTAVVISNHGSNLMPIFFGDIARMDWSGQFNVDFMSFLTLSALWLAWRHNFSPLGCLLALLGFFGGGLFLSAYLLVATGQAKGDARELLLGKARVSR